MPASTHRDSGGSAGLPAREIGPYQLMAELGKGSSGAVYLARRPGIERLYALKLLPPDLDPEGRARLEREARIASRLDHPDIVRAIDVGTFKDHLYLVMDHIPGDDLKARIGERGAHPWAEAAALVAAAARAVDSAHREGFVHRDLKPANIIIDGRDQRAKVTDFGLARDLSDTNLTRKGDLIGTPYYMSPEQVRGTPCDARADVYALGVILYELLTGERPFRAKGVHELSWKILKGEPTPPRELVDAIPAALEALCLKAMAVSAEERPQTAAELADALDAIAADQPGRAAGGRARAGRPSRTAWLLAALAAPLVLGAAAAWPLYERGRAEPLRQELAQRRTRAAVLERRLAELEAQATTAAEQGDARVADLRRQEEELARLDAAEADVREARERLARRLVEPDGHLARVVDRHIEELAGVPGGALLRASLLRNRARYGEALEVVSEALAAGADDPELYVVQFRAAAASGREREGAAAIRALLERTDETTHVGLFARIVGGRFPQEEILDAVRRGVEMAPDVGYMRVLASRMLIQFGLAERDVALVEECLAAAERAIELEPTSPDAFRERVRALEVLRMLRGGRPGEAVRIAADSRRARELAPEPGDWLSCGRALVWAGEPSGAVVELRRAREAARAAGAAEAEQFAGVWLANAYLLLGREDEALAALRAAREAGGAGAATAELAEYLHLASRPTRERILGAVEPRVREHLERALRARGG